MPSPFALSSKWQQFSLGRVSPLRTGVLIRNSFQTNVIRCVGRAHTWALAVRDCLTVHEEDAVLSQRVQVQGGRADAAPGIGSYRALKDLRSGATRRS
jgi:hypothetical protein